MQTFAKWRKIYNKLIFIEKSPMNCNKLTKAPWHNWIARPPPKGQVAGSSPAGVATFI